MGNDSPKKAKQRARSYTPTNAKIISDPFFYSLLNKLKQKKLLQTLNTIDNFKFDFKTQFQNSKYKQKKNSQDKISTQLQEVLETSNFCLDAQDLFINQKNQMNLTRNVEFIFNQTFYDELSQISNTQNLSEQQLAQYQQILQNQIIKVYRYFFQMKSFFTDYENEINLEEIFKNKKLRGTKQQFLEGLQLQIQNLIIQSNQYNNQNQKFNIFEQAIQSNINYNNQNNLSYISNNSQIKNPLSQQGIYDIKEEEEEFLSVNNSRQIDPFHNEQMNQRSPTFSNKNDDDEENRNNININNINNQFINSSQITSQQKENSPSNQQLSISQDNLHYKQDELESNNEIGQYQSNEDINSLDRDFQDNSLHDESENNNNNNLIYKFSFQPKEFHKIRNQVIDKNIYNDHLQDDDNDNKKTLIDNKQNKHQNKHQALNQILPKNLLLSTESNEDEFEKEMTNFNQQITKLEKELIFQQNVQQNPYKKLNFEVNHTIKNQKQNYPQQQQFIQKHQQQQQELTNQLNKNEPYNVNLYSNYNNKQINTFIQANNAKKPTLKVKGKQIKLIIQQEKNKLMSQQNSLQEKQNINNSNMINYQNNSTNPLNSNQQSIHESVADSKYYDDCYQEKYFNSQKYTDQHKKLQQKKNLEYTKTLKLSPNHNTRENIHHPQQKNQIIENIDQLTIKNNNITQINNLINKMSNNNSQQNQNSQQEQSNNSQNENIFKQFQQNLQKQKQKSQSKSPLFNRQKTQIENQQNQKNQQDLNQNFLQSYMNNYSNIQENKKQISPTQNKQKIMEKIISNTLIKHKPSQQLSQISDSSIIFSDNDTPNQKSPLEMQQKQLKQSEINTPDSNKQSLYNQSIQYPNEKKNMKNENLKQNNNNQNNNNNNENQIQTIIKTSQQLQQQQSIKNKNQENDNPKHSIKQEDENESNRFLNLKQIKNFVNKNKINNKNQNEQKNNFQPQGAYPQESMMLRKYSNQSSTNKDSSSSGSQIYVIKNVVKQIDQLKNKMENSQQEFDIFDKNILIQKKKTKSEIKKECEDFLLQQKNIKKNQKFINSDEQIKNSIFETEATTQPQSRKDSKKIIPQINNINKNINQTKEVQSFQNLILKTQNNKNDIQNNGKNYQQKLNLTKEKLEISNKENKLNNQQTTPTYKNQILTKLSSSSASSSLSRQYSISDDEDDSDSDDDANYNSVPKIQINLKL